MIDVIRFAVSMLIELTLLGLALTALFVVSAAAYAVCGGIWNYLKKKPKEDMKNED